MARLICKLPHASESITGPEGPVKFTPDRGQMLSEEVSDDVALHFAGIPGYVLVASPPADPAPVPAGRSSKTLRLPPSGSDGSSAASEASAE